MINGNILGKCLRSRSSCGGPRISPLAPQYECPRLSLSIITSDLGDRPYDKKSENEVLFDHSMHTCSGVLLPALSTPLFSKSTRRPSPDNRSRSTRGNRLLRSEPTGAASRAGRPSLPRSNYELFNRSNFNIRRWSWNYRGCWHQTCPPVAPRQRC